MTPPRNSSRRTITLGALRPTTMPALQNIGPVFITSVAHPTLQLEDRNGNPGLHQDKDTQQYWNLEPVPTPESLSSGGEIQYIPGAYYLLSHRTKRLEQKEGFLYGRLLDMRDVSPIQTTTRWVLSDAGSFSPTHHTVCRNLSALPTVNSLCSGVKGWCSRLRGCRHSLDFSVIQAIIDFT